MSCNSPWCATEPAARRRLLRAAPAALLAAWAAPWALAREGAAAVPAPPEAERVLGAAARLRGQARMRVFGLAIYDAWLWVGDGFEPAAFDQHALVLELRYARSLRGAQIAQRSLEEMRRVGPVADEQARDWLAFMTEAFPDVNEGDRLSGSLLPGAGARFLLNGTRSRELRDAAFARLFFGIWLSPRTSAPQVRTQLLGGAA